MTFREGERVDTPQGPGTVVFQRMAPPEYVEAAAVSVRLDSRRRDLTYTGTIYLAGLVIPRVVAS